MKSFPNISIGRTLMMLAATIVLLYVLFSMFVNMSEFSDAFSNMHPGFLGAAIFLSLSTAWINTMRWNSLLTLVNYPLPFVRAFRLVMASWTLSPLPGKVGDFLRSYPIRAEIPPSISLGTLVFEKAMDGCSLLLLSGIGFLFLGNIVGVALILSGMLLLYAFITMEKLVSVIPETWRGQALSAALILRKVQEHPSRLALPAIFSILNRTVLTLVAALLFLSLSIDVPYATTLAYFPLALFIGTIPITLAGIGIRDAALIGFFALYANASVIVVAGIAYTFLSFFLLGILGIPFLIKELRWTNTP